MEKIKDKLRKLLVMSERGTPGERDNAGKLLNQLLDKYNISAAELASNALSKYVFTCRNKNFHALLLQIVVMVINKRAIENYRYRGTQKYMFYLTPAQYIEVKHLYSVYSRELKKEYNRLVSAFIHKNHIFPPNPDNKNQGESKPLDPEEMMKIFKLANGLNKINVRKAIKG